MSKKHYELIAAAIQSVKTDSGEILGSASILHLVSERLADALAQDNPRFDQERFLAACGFVTP